VSRVGRVLPKKTVSRGVSGLFLERRSPEPSRATATRGEVLCVIYDFRPKLGQPAIDKEFDYDFGGYSSTDF
jgi:hypothetical protein